MSIRTIGTGGNRMAAGFFSFRTANAVPSRVPGHIDHDYQLSIAIGCFRALDGAERVVDVEQRG
ncbi:MAG TPA: hypothetical protein PKN13_10240 [Accumulibacter sp.]|nr:hypothetical protein [Accumulibacter sp.]HMW17929.1 hypothetical protein [Accumulibacter sp.]HMX21773.1 hypothetical protein [Accumulibacter sp.]HMY06658.1 hypothetical protein [Accumulibacter sp.]HNC18262.1 hypothetical protein [Accumulibacter sp.]